MSIETLNVVLQGPAGVGKTRLAQQLTQALQEFADDHRVVVVVSTTNAPLFARTKLTEEMLLTPCRQSTPAEES